MWVGVAWVRRSWGQAGGDALGVVPLAAEAAARTEDQGERDGDWDREREHAAKDDEGPRDARLLAPPLLLLALLALRLLVLRLLGLLVLSRGVALGLGRMRGVRVLLRMPLLLALRKGR